MRSTNFLAIFLQNAKKISIFTVQPLDNPSKIQYTVITMLQINSPDVNKLLSSIAALADVHISLFDKNFEPTALHSSNEDVNSFCPKIKKFTANKCQQSDFYAFERLNGNDNIFYYHCHFGFIEIACKIVFENQTLGYALIGPFRDPKKKKEDLERIQAFCQAKQLDYDELKDSYVKIPKFSISKYEALHHLICAIFDYSEMKNYISMKNNMFSSDIEPYILSHLQDKLTIEFLCEYFHVSQKMLYGVFQANAATTPKHYINKKRVEKAKHLISSTDMPLAEIASSVGVHDYNYFIKIFKSYTGKTPTYYKKH